MGKDVDLQGKTDAEIYAEPVPNIVAITVAINQITAGSGVNPYTIRNTEIIQEKKRKILYKNGRTAKPVTAAVLLEESERDIDHSSKLGRNIKVANPGVKRDAETDAHHIVARSDWRAEPARRILFRFSIGINDADNGVIIPRYSTTNIKSMPNAQHHQGIHTARYHAKIIFKLNTQAENTEAETRKTLRSIASDIIAGTF